MPSPWTLTGPSYVKYNMQGHPLRLKTGSPQCDKGQEFWKFEALRPDSLVYLCAAKNQPVQLHWMHCLDGRS